MRNTEKTDLKGLLSFVQWWHYDNESFISYASNQAPSFNIHGKNLIKHEC